MTTGERLLLTLTFWLRPDFVLRVVNRFQRIAGFDRAIALASSAFTASIALAVLYATLFPRAETADFADRLIRRLDLGEAGAEAVTDMFARSGDDPAGIGLLGALLLLVAVLSFARAVQRLWEQTWELAPLSVRNTVNGIIWIAGLSVWLAASAWLRQGLSGPVGDLTQVAILVPLGAVFFAWTMRTLTAQRLAWRDTPPTAVVAAAVFELANIAAGIYVPRLFDSYADRFGAVGAVLAMISWLFGLMLVLVASAATGREVTEELRRLAAGVRPGREEVQRQWDAVIAEARSHYSAVRGRLPRRGGDSPPGS